MEHESKGEEPIVSSKISSLLGLFINPKFLEFPMELHSQSEGILEILPVELLINILLRLPFIDLLRFKLTCKSVRSLISSPEFADLHLRQSLDCGSNSPFLVFKDIAACYSIEMDKLEMPDLTTRVHHRLAHCTEILGSCNGLICGRNGRSDAFLYNPSTRDRHELPTSPMDKFDVLKYGFGYDSVSGDYKVLKIFPSVSGFSNRAVALSSTVYSLKNNFWKKLENFPTHIDELISDHGVLCNQTLHWVFRERNGPAADVGVLGFELHKETHNLVPLPSSVLKSRDLTLATLGGYLCVSQQVGRSNSGRFLVWVMKDYGVKDSWTSLIEIDGFRSVACIKPIAYSKSEEEVLVDISGTHFLWFDLRKKKVKCYVPCHHSGAVLCLQSVVFPRSA